MQFCEDPVKVRMLLCRKNFLRELVMSYKNLFYIIGLSIPEHLFRAPSLKLIQITKNGYFWGFWRYLTKKWGSEVKNFSRFGFLVKRPFVEGTMVKIWIRNRFLQNLPFLTNNQASKISLALFWSQNFFPLKIWS